MWEDLQRINEIPCARNSLLSGIASGAGVGVIRGLSAGTCCPSPVRALTEVLHVCRTRCIRGFELGGRHIYAYIPWHMVRASGCLPSTSSQSFALGQSAAKRETTSGGGCSKLSSKYQHAL